MHPGPCPSVSPVKRVTVRHYPPSCPPALPSGTARSPSHVALPAAPLIWRYPPPFSDVAASATGAGADATGSGGATAAAVPGPPAPAPVRCALAPAAVSDVLRRPALRRHLPGTSQGISGGRCRLPPAVADRYDAAVPEPTRGPVTGNSMAQNPVDPVTPLNTPSSEGSSLARCCGPVPAPQHPWIADIRRGRSRHCLAAVCDGREY